MPDWSIKIVPSGSGAAFQPDIPGSNPGDPLIATQDDLVTWNNTTDEAHQPWQTDSNYQPLSDAWVATHAALFMSNSIPAGRPSTPAYDVAQPGDQAVNGTPPSSWTIYYCCKLHPSEHGTIEAAVPPAN